MTKRKVTKLFAVVALATSAPAVAGPGHDHPAPAPTPAKIITIAVQAPQADPWVTPDRATPAKPPQQLSPITAQVLALFGISVPRRLASGAPACGNVASRAPRPADCQKTKP